jgi:hypothetical protein
MGTVESKLRIGSEICDVGEIQANGRDRGVNWLKAKGKGKREKRKVAGKRDYAVTR